MANHKSSKKRAKQTITKTIANKSRVSEVKTILKNIRTAIAKNDKETALQVFPKTQKLLAKLAQKGVIKSENAARKTSRLASQINKL